MAPEVIKGKGYGRRSDIWSLGCTVVEMVTGRPPWSEIGNTITAMFRITSDDEPAPVPVTFEMEGQAFLFRCFVRKAGKRATALELSQHQYVTGLVISAVIPSDCRATSAPGIKRLKPRKANSRGTTPVKMSRHTTEDVQTEEITSMNLPFPTPPLCAT